MNNTELQASHANCAALRRQSVLTAIHDDIRHGARIGMKELILNFHGLGKPPASLDSAEVAFWLNKDAFEEVLDRLGEQTLAYNMQFKLTFDDGNLSDALIALPALAKRGMKATFFVCAGRIGKTGYLDSLAIQDLFQGGMELGSHGMHHVDWRHTSKCELQTEIWCAKRVLENVTGRSINEAAIPFGSYNRRVLSELRLAGFSAAYSSDGGVADTNVWLRPRNTLYESVRLREVMQNLVRHNTFLGRLYRSTITTYKALR